MSAVPVHPPLLYLPDAQLVHVLHWNPFVFPLQDPLRYCPLAQFWLEHVEQAVSAVPEHPPLLYLPDAQLVHVLHWNPFVVPLQDPLRYCLLTQVMLKQAVQVPGLLPDRHWLVLQATLERSSQLYPLDVPVQVPVRR